MHNEILLGKLKELEQKYHLLQKRIKIFQNEDHKKIHRELQKAIFELQENEQFLENCAENASSPAIIALAKAQLEYIHTTNTLLYQKLPEFLHDQDSCEAEDQAEASILYAEYAIDFAVQSAQYALTASLLAQDLQISDKTGSSENS